MAKPGNREPRTRLGRVGLIGGMSWRSTALYYERLNLACEALLGAHHSFAGLVWNLDYAVLLSRLSEEGGGGVEATLVEAARGLADSGCDIIALTAVTAHLWHPAVAAAAAIPTPHIMDAARRKIDASGIGTVGVLGTGHTCRSSFVRERLAPHPVVVLDADEQAELDGLIETLTGNDGVHAAARRRLEASAALLRRRGAEVVLLACTELPLLLPMPGDVPLIDCVALHVTEICDHIMCNQHAR